MDDDRDWIEDAAKKSARVTEARRKLIARGELAGRIQCPCGAEGRTLFVQLSEHRNRHARAKCEACDFWMMQ